MKAYAITTGSVFGLILVTHILRIAMEGLTPAKDPVFILFTVASAILTLWSVRVLKSLPKV